jgi:hypothetical protein
MTFRFRIRHAALLLVGFVLAVLFIFRSGWIDVITASGFSCFYIGFLVAIVAFWNEISIGIQVRREARKKIKESMSVRC